VHFNLGFERFTCMSAFHDAEPQPYKPLFLQVLVASALFWLFFGVVSLLPVLVLVTVHLLGKFTTLLGALLEGFGQGAGCQKASSNGDEPDSQKGDRCK
jgi:hypothetical protein